MLLRAIDDNVFLLFGYKWLRASVCVCVTGFQGLPVAKVRNCRLLLTHTHMRDSHTDIFPYQRRDSSDSHDELTSDPLYLL